MPDWMDIGGVNEGYVLELYERFLQDPSAVDAGTRTVFEKWAPVFRGADAATAGPAVHQAAAELARRIEELAAEILEAAPEDLRLERGRAGVVGQPGTDIPFSVLVSVAKERGVELDVTSEQPFGQAAYAYGTHVAEVEVDPETGHVQIVSYTLSHDCGPMLNPMIVAGQIEGGVAHGVGNALYERVAFDDEGQPLVTTFVDYRIPAAAQVPPVRHVHKETPSYTNLLGVRGAGEGGTIPAAAAIVAAVEDALGVVVDRYPLTPEVVLGFARG